MTQDRTARPVVALLALAGLLLGMFALHCQMTGHEMHGASSVSSSPMAAHHADEAVTLAVITLAAPAVATLTFGAGDGLLDCALLAMTCVLLLTLVVSVFLRRRPATYRRLLDAGGAARGVVWRTVTVPAPRPGLTLLCISRV
ncbi:hypothetical protein E3T55_03070 [Cryobacterium frigoriphilum]|uniref:Uncharacterized protein n=1 Tax=Cryobacterium frigoriphilum TaxID=1259150 RepID=A0A4V3IS22_9MICO|nr:hypothetical protein [Cryobacterium frigoriphilum]TFD54434.1 hypothetical protein E3T55_03070 [Cryobacterium frigoriphilum]